MSSATSTRRDAPLELRPYQREAARAIVESVMRGEGHIFTVEIARQGGKNEISAQVEMFLLGLHAWRGGDIIKCAPTFAPQLQVSMRRLWARLSRSPLRQVARLGKAQISVAAARIHFLSADPHANVVGHTASLLLEVDEAQDVDPDKFDRDFRPLAAAHNATTVLYGTAWHDRTLLERAKQANLEAERRDGIRRHFEYDWQAVAAAHPEYRRYAGRARASRPR